MNTQSNTHAWDWQNQSVGRDRMEQELRETQETLGREVYRLDLAEMRLQMAEDQIHKLESWTLTGIVSSLMGDNAGRIDAIREECRQLEREYQERVRTIETLQQQIERIKGQIAGLAETATESQTDCPAGSPVTEPGRAAAVHGGTQTRSAGFPHRLEMAIEAGESLLNHLNGSYRLSSSLRHGKNLGGRGGALLNAAMQAYRNKTANTLTGEVANSVGHLCDQVALLELDPQNRAHAEILTAASQLRQFAESGSSTLGTEAEAWADLEILARSLVSDLQDLTIH